MTVLVWSVLISVSVLTAAAKDGHQMCPEIVYLASPDVHQLTARRNFRRVEVRRCRDDRANVLQLVAWKQGERYPTIVKDTDRFAISQAVMFGDVVAIEFGGGGSNKMYVITFENGQPTIALEDGYKAYAQIGTTIREVFVRIPQRNGDPKMFRFQTGLK